jgi:hypothetical protein
MAKRVLQAYEANFRDDLLSTFFEDAPTLPEGLSMKTVDADLILKQAYGAEARIVFLGWLRLFSCI